MVNCKYNFLNGLIKVDIGYNYCKVGLEEIYC